MTALLARLTLSTLLRGIAGAALAAGLAWLGYQWHAGVQARAQVEMLQAELSAAHEALSDAETERATTAARHARELDAIEKALAKERQTAEAAADLLATIDATDPARDGAVAPVLSDTLRGLK
jgi:septal ring factor EnvC (AmiA/AmiB activator)